MADAGDRKSFWTTLPGILTGIAGVIAAITGLVVALFATDIFGGSTPSSTPISAAVPTPIFSSTIAHELEINVDPREAAEFLVNPKANPQGRYPAGTTVIIDVLPKAGWQVDDWVGPVHSIAGRTARINMDSNQKVIVVMARAVPTPTPSASPTPTTIPPPIPSAPDIRGPSAPDISGKWSTDLDSFIDFARISANSYIFEEFDAFGDTLSEGTAVQVGTTLILRATSVAVGSFSAELAIVSNALMQGTVSDAFGNPVGFLALSR